MSLRQSQQLAERSIWKFLLVAYGLFWLLAFPGIRLAHGNPNNIFDIIGGFAPAVAAMLLSYRGQHRPQKTGSTRLAWLWSFWVLIWASVYVGTLIRFPVAIPIQVEVASGISFALVMLLPAWVMSGAFSRDAGVHELLQTLARPRPWFWQIVALLSYALYLTVPAFITKLSGGHVYYPNLENRWHSSVVFAVTSFSITFFGNCVGEEPGWRGYLLPTLQRKMSPLQASIAVWLIWAIWHLPVDLTGFAGQTIEDYLKHRFAVLLPVTIIMTWLYNRSGGSILACALFHAAFDSFNSFLPSVSGTTSILYVWAVAVIISDQMWRFREREPLSVDVAETSPSEQLMIDGRGSLTCH